MLPRPKISKRMQYFIEEALEFRNEPFWDFCCDHGYVGIKALSSGAFSEVHFVDQVPHIMDRLQKLINQLGCSGTYFLHYESGEKINQEVHGTLLIAGVGGLTIKTILSSLLASGKLKAKRLLLSPHTDEKVLVAYLQDNDFQKIYNQSQKVLITEGKRQRPLYIIDQS